MNCNYTISTHNKKRLSCPSAAHEAFVLLGRNPGDEDKVVMFCLHHCRVMEAKLSNSLEMEVNEHGEFVRSVIQEAEREVAD